MLYKNYTKLLFFILSNLVLNSLQSQLLQNKYNDSDYALIDEFAYKKGSGIHTSIKPYAKWKIDSVIRLDSIYKLNTNNKFVNWVFNKNFVEFNKDNFWFTVNPYMNFEFAKDKSEKYFKNTRGIQVDASIGERFAMHTAFYENQGTFPDYMNEKIISLRVLPGQGYRKVYKENGHDYAYAEGYVSFSASKYFNFQFGHGKNFFGDGYNSLLLSDRAFNYPYFKISTDIWKIKYINLYTQFIDINTPSEQIDGFKRKNASIHYLSWNATERLNISLFESIIWEASDSTSNRGFDVNYLNPVIFYRPVEFSLGSPDNAMMGLNVRYTVFQNTHLYSQFVLDEFKLNEIKDKTGWWANKSGLQLGLKSFHRINKNAFFVQGEYTFVRPFTYSHMAKSQCYGHYNEPLAHPLGANFKEALVRLKYSRGRFQANAMLRMYQKGIDSTVANSWGGDVFKPYTLRTKEYGNYILQGVLQEVSSANVFVSYLINYKYNLNIAAGVFLRKELLGDTERKNTIIYVALRTSLRNIFNY